MEEVKAYIESGILELYVLGQLSAQENAEVEAMANKYPEIKRELSLIETALEAYAVENAISPSKGLDEQILATINAKSSEHSKIIPFNDASNNIRIKVLRYSLVACIALLVVFAASLYSLKRQLNTAHQQIASLSTQREQFTRTISRLKFEKAGMENRIAMTETNEWMTVKLAGTKSSPNAKMLVYWNKINKNILINYAAIDLPRTDQRHEYQLWALVDGKPVSLGVFGSDENAAKAVKEMETIQQAQAFAVTIEPMGGSINPTMEKMVAMGTI